MIAKLFAGQARKPTGLFGRFVARAMARGNVYEIAWTVSLLDVQAKDHVLEVGFGPGVSIQMISDKATDGLAAGVDLSPTMVDVARRRNASAIRAGRVELRQGDVTALPFGTDSFDKAFSIHSLYFWSKPAQGLKELWRVLKPNGLLAITVRPQGSWDKIPPRDVFTLYSGSQVEQLLTEAGFRQTRVETSPDQNRFPGICVLGVK